MQVLDFITVQKPKTINKKAMTYGAGQKKSESLKIETDLFKHFPEIDANESLTEADQNPWVK